MKNFEILIAATYLNLQFISLDWKDGELCIFNKYDTISAQLTFWKISYEFTST